jgi:hypothetical protein
MSDFQALKLAIIDTLGLGRDSLHLYIGFACLLASATLWRNKRSFLILLPGLIASVVLESVDLRDDMIWLGKYRWYASLHDIANTNLLPLLTFLVFRRHIPKT